MKQATETKTLMTLALAAAAFALVSCGEEAVPDPDHAAAGPVAETPATTATDGDATTTPVADTYPLDVCVVSGEKLGSMGDPVVIDHEGTTVKFCCESCVPRFKKDPDAYLSKLNPPAGE